MAQLTKPLLMATSLVHQYNVAVVPLKVPGNPLDPNNYLRKVHTVCAAPGVSWEMIATEVHRITNEPNYFLVSQRMLETCTCERDDVVIGYSYGAFIQMCKELAPKNHVTFDEQIERLAKELVGIRDTEECIRVEYAGDNDKHWKRCVKRHHQVKDGIPVERSFHEVLPEEATPAVQQA